MRPYIICSLLAITMMTSCLQQQEQPVSKEEALAFAKSLDSAIEIGDEEYFGKQVNLDVLFERMEKNNEIKMTSSLRRGIRDGLSTRSVANQIILETGGGKGSYALVKQYEKDKRQHVIFRLFGEQGINYHDFELIKFNGKVSIADFLIYITGENFSQSLADLANGILDAEKVNKGQEAADKLSLIRKLVLQNNYREAKKVYDGLPAAFKLRKTVQIIHLKVCLGLDEQVFEKALGDFEARYGNEPEMALTFLDIYFLRKDFARALNAIDKVDAMLGGDPFLDYYRGLIYYNWGKQVEARVVFEKLYKSYPEFARGTMELIHNYLAAGDYEQARTVIAAYRENDKLDQDLLDNNLAVYPDFKE